MAGNWARILVPGLAFQAVVIGGGYATGRELVAFFMGSGPIGGLIAMAVTMAVWGAAVAVSLEFARRFEAYDYQTFFKKMIGPGWVLFEIAYVALIILVISVVCAAAGAIGRDSFGFPTTVGAIAMVVASTLILFYGDESVKRLLSYWSVLLYICYTAFFLLFCYKFGGRIADVAAAHPLGPGIAMNGITYAAVNLNCFVAILFLVPTLRTRREAITAGLLVGPIAMLPGALFYATMIAFYPDIQTAEIPLNILLAALDVPVFGLVFQIAILGTLLQTGVGLLHAINERIAHVYARRGKQMPSALRGGVALFFMIFSTVTAEAIGLVALIDKGYGALSWVFIAVMMVPILTVGLWKIRGREAPAPA